MTMNNSTKRICLIAMGIALYVCVSMIISIPIVGHISLDLGYIVLAIYCYLYGSVAGAIVGTGGCFFVSLLSSGWIPIGWMLGNLFIGVICGRAYSVTKGEKYAPWINLFVTIVAVFVGIGLIKTVVECVLYSIPVSVKFAKDLVAFAMDATTMCAGLLLSSKIKI